jgi:predicted MPP superfamily phosphohydrolase
MPLFILTIIASMLALDLTWWLCADRAVRKLRRPHLWRIAIASFMNLQMLTLAWIIFGRVIGQRPEQILPSWATGAVFLWHFILLPFGTLVWALLGAWNLLARIRPKGPATPLEPAPPALPTRRQFLTAAAAAAPPLLTGITTAVGATQLDDFRVRAITVPLASLPPALDGMTIAHVTDIHVGSFTRGRVLDRIVETTNALKADLVLMTGDLINNALFDLPAALDVVKRMDPRAGLIMCEGNHDLIENRAEFERRTKASGVPLLINETTTLRVRGHDVQLLGLRWGSASPTATRAENRGDASIGASFAVLRPLIDPHAFPILLAHHPHAFDVAAAAGIPLTLAGHTHGGQLMLTDMIGFGPLMFRYWTGLYRKGDSALVVSNGVGNWFPLRTRAPAEIVHVTLRRATS